jgi:hypothetical protein
MYKALGLVSAAAVAAVLASHGAQAMPSAATSVRSAAPAVTLVWDNCGVGLHRNRWGRCISNYANDSRGCPPGFHLGYQVHRCIPNR